MCVFNVIACRHRLPSSYHMTNQLQSVPFNFVFQLKQAIKIFQFESNQSTKKRIDSIMNDFVTSLTWHWFSLLCILCILFSWWLSNPIENYTWFERISMMAIVLNCITLGMYHPCGDEVCDTTRCRLLEMFDDFIFIFFAVEMLIKMIAMGVRGTRGAYLSETWNRLDAFIVIAG